MIVMVNIDHDHETATKCVAVAIHVFGDVAAAVSRAEVSPMSPQKLTSAVTPHSVGRGHTILRNCNHKVKA